MALALVDSDLKRLIKNGMFKSDIDIIDYVQPASIDLPLGNRAYLISHKFIPFRKSISYVANKIKIEEFDLTRGAILYKGHTYLVKVGDIVLPKAIYAKISPKSSIGRVDIMVRAICDNSGMYDYIPAGGSGELWLEITPQSFNVRVRSGISMSQLRLFEGEHPQSIIRSNARSLSKKFLFDTKGRAVAALLFEGKLILSLGISEEDCVGYEALPVNDVIDLERSDNDWSKFFKRITKRKMDSIVLEKDKFYILSTKELVNVPPVYCLEMIPFSHLVGELRVHYAGFFDPGFGNPVPASGVLEIRPHETLVVYDSQPICLMEIYKLTKRPSAAYGKVGNHYQGQQGARLAKYFVDVK